MKELFIAMMLAAFIFPAAQAAKDPVSPEAVHSGEANPKAQNPPGARIADAGQCGRDAFPAMPPPSLIGGTSNLLKPGEFVTVQVPHDEYASHFVQKGDGVQPTPVLYINDMALKGLQWTYSGCEKIAFLLERTEASRDVWGKVLARLDGKEGIPVGIGTAQHGFVMDIGTAKLVLTSKGDLLWGFIEFSLIAAIFVLGSYSGLLRDLPASPNNAGAPPGGCADRGKGRPFSLARVQMAWWFVLTVGAYLFIWLKTGDLSNTIPDSMLALMGISAGTTVLSAVVDSSSPGRREEASCGFLFDILSDSDSISFHRFQMFVWTIVLGIIFIVKVRSTLIMPDFDDSLLGLMGVSSGAYLGFKIPAMPKSGSGGKPAPQPEEGSKTQPAVG